MNAVARVVGRTATIARSPMMSPIRPLAPFVITGEMIRVSVLTAVVLLSALSVVYVKDLSRRLFIEQQQAMHERDVLHTGWGKLLLEESTWSRQARIQHIAQQRLGMHVPKSRRLVTLS